MTTLKQGGQPDNTNARKHGVLAVKRRGEAGLKTTAERSRYAEITELAQDRQGLIVLLQERAVNAFMVAEMAQNYTAQKIAEGKSFEKVAIGRSLPAYWNSAGRAIKDLYDVLPDEPIQSAELARIKKVLENVET